MNIPHGGKLINRYLAKRSDKSLLKLPALEISEVGLCDLHNIAEGVFSPLKGFMLESELNEVIFKNKINGIAWTVPILLDVDKKFAQNIKKKELVVLKRRKEIVGTIEVAGVYPHKKNIIAKKVFGTKDINHPGVRFVYEMKDYLLGGKVKVFKPKSKIKNYLSPKETREIFAKRGYKAIAGFQTRNVLHRAHEYLQRCALELVDGLFLQPIAGWKKKGDFRPQAVVKAYQEFIKDYYPKERIVFGTLKTAMRYAGPKEAVFHAIIRKNFGCTHFIVGRDHAGVGGYYGKYEAQEIFNKIKDLGVEILKFKEPLYCSKCDLIVTEKTCCHSSRHHQIISGTLVRKILKDGHQPKNQIFRPEVYNLLRKEFKAHHLFY